MDIVKRWRAALKEVTDLGGMELKNKLTVSANNKGKHSIGCLFWLLARMVLQMRSVINQGHKWEVMVDLFFYREPEESKGKQEEDAAVENYADYSTAAIGGTDQWPNQITDSKCNDKGISPAIPAVPGVTWTPDAAPITSDGWDGAVEPPMHVATGVDIIPPGFEEQGQRDEWNRRERVSDHKTPADFLISISGRPVVIKLNSGVDYRALCLMNSRKTASTTCFTILGIKFSCYVYGRQGTKL